MGFLKAMKGANNYWAMVSCANGIGYLGPENLLDNRAHRLSITGSGMETVVFGTKDVKSIDMICATSEWIKYSIVLKNNKRYIATFMVLSLSQQKGKNSGFLPSGTVDAGKKVSMGLLNFEWWMAEHLYKQATPIQPVVVQREEMPTESVSVKANKEPVQTEAVKVKETKQVVVPQEEKHKVSSVEKVVCEEIAQETDADKEKQYQFAVQMMETRRYEIAYNAFIKVKGYKKADEYIADLENKI